MGYDASIPLRKSATTGWELLSTAKAAVRQDLKILLLTSPGERIMDPDFGVGLRRYLFQPLTRNTLGSIETRIREQVRQYLPFIQIRNISFSSASSAATNTVVTDMDENALNISISYSFGRGYVDELSVSP